MPRAIEISLLESYSRGEITRREVSERAGEEVSFGTLLGQLHEHGLPLPRLQGDPHWPGAQLVRQLAERAGPRAG